MWYEVNVLRTQSQNNYSTFFGCSCKYAYMVKIYMGSGGQSPSEAQAFFFLHVYYANMMGELAFIAESLGVLLGFLR